MDISVILADYSSEQHCNDIIYLLDLYARDPMGGGNPLPEYVKRDLTKELSQIPGAYSVICYCDKKPVGFVNCFMGFSTFKCKPLVNVHDIAVIGGYRGLGLSQLMMHKVEEVAKSRGCCKITLEVLEGNLAARNCYTKFGFDGYELDPKMGKALFWQKNFNSD